MPISYSASVALGRIRGLYEITRGRGPYDNQERDVALLYLEIVAASVLSAAVNFNGALALRLGASNALIGLMTALPALITMVGMVPASAVLVRSNSRWLLMLRSLMVTRVLIFGVVLIPIFVPGALQAAVLVGLLTFRFATALYFSAGWDSILAEVVPPRLRAQVFSWRNILSTGAVIVALLLIRPWLQWAPFPLNYEVVYLVGGLGGLASMWFLTRMRVATYPAPRSARGRLSRGAIREAMRGNPQFIRFLANTLVGNLGAFLASPLYIIYYVRQLGASDAWIASSTLVANVAAMLGFVLARRFIPRFGEGKLLRITWPLTGLLPLLIGTSGSLNVVLVIIFCYQVVTPLLNLSHYNMLLEVTPADRRPTYISVFGSLNNALAFVLPMVGVALAEAIGPGVGLVLAGALWIAGGLVFSIWPVRVGDTSRQAA